MAIALIDQFTHPFDITDYKDTYSEALMKLIKAKAKGVKIPTTTLRVVHKASDDLMSQLKASLSPGKKRKAS